MAAVAIVLVVGLGAVVSLQANVIGTAQDDAAVFTPASDALYRIRDELKSAVQSPDGVTALPLYAVSATSITFRPAEGVIYSTDPSYASMSAAGRVSKANVLYAAYAKTIAWDSAARTVTLTTAGGPAGMPAVEVLARDVVDFAFFDGESRTSPPAPPTASSYVIGIRLTVRRPSARPGARGTDATSAVGGAELTTKVLVPPETLVNRKLKPVTGP